MQLFIGINPLSIKIDEAEIAPIIANDDSIGIEHRHNFEDKIFS